MEAELTKDQEFSATPAMKLYSFQKAKLGKKAKDSQISKLIGVRPETIARWKHINGFSEWLEEAVMKYTTPINDLLDQTAIDNIGNFRFWEAMSIKHGHKVDAWNGAVEFRLAYSLPGKKQIVDDNDQKN